VVGIDLAEDKQALAVIDHDVRVLARKTVKVQGVLAGRGAGLGRRAGQVAKPPAQPGKVRPRLGQARPDPLGVVPYERVTPVLIEAEPLDGRHAGLSSR
jgi:hypothetical protein